MATIEGTHTITYTGTYTTDDLHKFVGRDPLVNPLTQEEMKEIADILTANLEPVEEWDGTAIDPFDRGIFNDSYRDMEEDLKERYAAK